MPQPGDGPTIARLRLGAHLRRLRQASGATGGQAAAVIGSSTSKISRLESGLLPVRDEDVHALLGLYGGPGPACRDELLALARESARPGWWDRYSDVLPARIRRPLELEAAADFIGTYDCLAVPALLQTEDYARALSGADQGHPGWRGCLAPDMLARRRALLASGQPPRIWALVDEAALRRVPSGGPAVMGGQVAHLIEAAAGPHITVQVVPAASPGPLAMAGPFTLLRFPAPDLPDAVFLELLTDIVTLTRSHDVERHWAAFNLLASRALDPDPSLATLRALRRGR